MDRWKDGDDQCKTLSGSIWQTLICPETLKSKQLKCRFCARWLRLQSDLILTYSLSTRPFVLLFLDWGGGYCASRDSSKKLWLNNTQTNFLHWWFKHCRWSFRSFSHDDDSPFMNEFFQRRTFRHQLRTLTPHSYKGQNGQQVICTAVRLKKKEGREIKWKTKAEVNA